MDGDLAAPAEVHTAGGVKEARELGKAVALAARCDRSELAAELLRE
jgi:hypothetical protein